MTIKEALVSANQILKKAKIDSYTLDSELLLAKALNLSREKIYSRLEKKLTQGQIKKFKKLLSRRQKREPMAYILGQKEFYGLNFFVDQRVLIPRPETELIVENILEKISHLPLQDKIAIIDVGTGSGCLIISLKKNLLSRPNSLFLATDISKKALSVAKKNAQKYQLLQNIKFFQGNLLKPIIPFLRKNKLDGLFIAANLPYLPTKEYLKTQPEIRFYEPREALDGGKNGLIYHRQLFEQLLTFYKSIKKQIPCSIFFEICPHQANDLRILAQFYFPQAKITVKKDLNKFDRLVIVEIRN